MTQFAQPSPRPRFDKNYWDHCVRKVKLGSEAEAMAHFNTILEMSTRPHLLEMYVCEYCEYIHVGHRPGPGSRRGRRKKILQEFMVAGGGEAILERVR